MNVSPSTVGSYSNFLWRRQNKTGTNRHHSDQPDTPKLLYRPSELDWSIHMSRSYSHNLSKILTFLVRNYLLQQDWLLWNIKSVNSHFQGSWTTDAKYSFCKSRQAYLLKAHSVVCLMFGQTTHIFLDLTGSTSY